MSETARAFIASNDLHAASPLPAMNHLMATMIAVRDGYSSDRLPPRLDGLQEKLSDTFNEILAANRRVAHGLAEASLQVGGEGRSEDQGDTSEADFNQYLVKSPDLTELQRICTNATWEVASGG